MSDTSQLQFVWKQIYEKLEKMVPKYAFNSFFQYLEPVDLSARKIILKATSAQAIGAIMKSHAETFRNAIVACDLGGITDFRLIVDESELYVSDEDDEDLFRSAPINKNFTFDSFVAGAGTKFAYAAAKAVAESPGEAFNPLFIYGESGLGKTHLLHAIANHITQKFPKKKVLYTTSENFLNDMIDMIAHKNGSRFRYHYRDNVDVLMIDDIQFLKAKMSTQEEFFHTFNALIAENKQIVVASDRPPKEIAALEERIRTRFEGGMIADVQPPDLETKIAILKRKALDKKCPVPEDVLELLAQSSSHDVRTLEGRLTKVIFASRLHEEPITVALAKKALNESVDDSEEQEEISPERVISAVCGYFKITKAELVGKSKKAELVKARQICAYVMCDMLSMPLQVLGKTLDRDHTTIMYARDKMKKQASLNDRIAKEIDDIRNIILKK